MMQSSRKPYQVAKLEYGWGEKGSEKVPLGIRDVHLTQSQCVSVDGNEGVLGNGEALPAEQRTFAVTPHHEPILGGVRFNVEDVEATKKDKAMPSLSASELYTTTAKEIRSFYADNDPHDWMSSGPVQQEKEAKVEVTSAASNNLVYAGSDGFLRACLFAFARHLPLAISPDHIWTLVTYAFAKHVDKHAKELREHFVQHEGKKRIEIIANELRLGASPPEQWEEQVFPQFSEKIKENVKEGVHGDVVSAFSTTDATARACGEITLMATTKNYFSFGMQTMCGIPSVTLLGTEEDWAEVRSKAEALSLRMTPDFRAKWMPCLLPILDEFVSSFKGNVNHGFWQSMVKLRDTGGGSGSYSFISGWVQNLYPYLGSGEINPHLRPWEHAFFKGPEFSDFPGTMSSAPVDWDYFGTVYKLHFHAGFSGFTQHQEGSTASSSLLLGTVMPALGWAVSHDPPKGAAARIAEIDQEVADLLKGHLPNHHKHRRLLQQPTVMNCDEESRVVAIAMKIVRMEEVPKPCCDGEGGEQADKIDTHALKSFLEESTKCSPVFREESWVRRLGQLSSERESLAP